MDPFWGLEDDDVCNVEMLILSTPDGPQLFMQAIEDIENGEHF